MRRKNKDGSVAEYVRFAHNYRDPEVGYAKPKILFNFGRRENVDEDALRRLVRSIGRFLGPEDSAMVQAELDGFGTDLTVECSLAYGGSYVLDAMWRRLELDQTLRELLREREYEIDVERLLFALVANRALDPRSKLVAEQWVGRHVAIDGLDEVQVHGLYRAMDFLVEHAKELQEQVVLQDGDAAEPGGGPAVLRHHDGELRGGGARRGRRRSAAIRTTIEGPPA